MAISGTTLDDESRESIHITYIWEVKWEFWSMPTIFRVTVDSDVNFGTRGPSL